MIGHFIGFFLDEIGQDVFRPARKHGYSDRRICDLIEKIESYLPNDDNAWRSANGVDRCK